MSDAGPITSVMAFDKKRFSSEILTIGKRQVYMHDTYYVDKIHCADIGHLKRIGNSMMIDPQKLVDAGIDYIVITVAGD